MRIARTVDELKLNRSHSIGLVPTMGAFHEGHLQLMRRAKEENECVVVSLFVNPLQFGKGEDFTRYPRNLDADAAMAESVGVDILFAPEVTEVYRREISTTVSVPEVTERWEGAYRPGHFDGVATVVAKLFNMVGPDVAYFGRKDFQQCAVIRRMVEDLNMPLDLSIEPTVRETDGLAMSSRNRYLDSQQRQLAPLLYRTLQELATSVQSGEPVEDRIGEFKIKLNDAGFSVDYLAYIADDSLAPLGKFENNSSLIVAAKLGTTRLIDNISVA